MLVKKESLPNLLTVSRIALIPVLLLFVYLPYDPTAWLAVMMYVWICFTDFLDGYLARKYNVVSSIGTFLDPIADKILIAVLLVVFVDIGYLDDFWVIPVMVILVREFVISGLREFLATKEVKVPVTLIAKWKTTIQMVALGGLLLTPVHLWFLYLGQAGILAAAAITAYTGFIYVQAAWKDLKDEK